MAQSITTAEELAAQQQEISVAEFFEKNKHMLGFDSNARSLVTAIKEAVDNSIDAAEEARILPVVDVSISESGDGIYTVTVVDNGPGITKEQIPKIFGQLLYGSRFGSRVQTRGQQGIGISAAVLYSQLTTGHPAEIVSKTQSASSASYFEVSINTDENEPTIESSKSVDWEYEFQHGTEISIQLEATFRARTQLHKYIRHTAITNPHVSISLSEPQHELSYDRTVNELPPEPTEINPHPHGIEVGSLEGLIAETNSHKLAGFLQNEFTRVGKTTAKNIISNFQDSVYGKQFRWKVPNPDDDLTEIEASTPSDQETLESTIRDSINRKPDSVTKALTKKVCESLVESSPVAYSEVTDIVSNSASSVESDFGSTLGETVQSKIVTSAWDCIQLTRKPTLSEILSHDSLQKTDDDITTFVEMLAQLLETESSENADNEHLQRDIYTRSELKDIVSRGASRSTATFGETAQEKITDLLREQMQRSDREIPSVKQIASDTTLINGLHAAMKQTDVMAPPSKCLSPITEDHLINGLKQVHDAEFYCAETRSASAHNGEPFLVESGIAYGGDVGDEDLEIELLRFANRVPLVYKRGGCEITSVVSNINWYNYELSDKGGGLPQGPVAIVVHIASTNVPFTSESKDAVASVEVIADEVERAVRGAARQMKDHISHQQSLRKQQRKQEKIQQILPTLGDKLAAITGSETPDVNRTMAKVMNNCLVEIESIDSDDSHSAIAITNHMNNSISSQIKLVMNEKPAIDQTLSVLVVNENGVWTIQWNISLEAESSSTKQLQIDPTNISNVEIDSIPDENITISYPK